MKRLTNRGVRVATLATLTGLACAVVCASTENLHVSIPALVACVLCLPFVELFTYHDN